MTDAGEPSAFEDAVAGWLQSYTVTRRDPYAPTDFRRVVSVTGDGTDWDGDTEHGFYSSFRVSIRYERPDGSTWNYEVEGEAMQSLWEFVTRPRA